SFAVEVPPSWPGYHISRTAFTLLSQGISTGSPVLSTTIVLGLACATAAMSASSLGASELTSSVLTAPLSSANTKATFAALAAATAALSVSPKRDQVSRKICGVVRGIGVPTLFGQTVLSGMAAAI